MDKLTNLFWVSVHSRIGMLVQWLVGVILGSLLDWLKNSLGIEVPPDLAVQMHAVMIGLGVFVVTHFVQRYQSKQAGQLQEALNLPPQKVDQWIGPETIRIAEAAMQKLERSGR